MSFEIKTIPSFAKELKILAKKYHSIKQEFNNLLDILEVTPNLGEPLGKNCYKIRLAIKSKNKGKSGGARIITCVKVIKKTVYLLAIYDKADLENITENDLI